MNKVAGLDGCKAGWLMFYKNNNHYSFRLISSIEAGRPILEECSKIFIDMPIGLSSQGFKRGIEKQMIQLLKNRSSTIFTPPCREALALSDYKKANPKNKAITGKGLSIQAFNIGKKIKEVDNFIENASHIELAESHPEICFKVLKGEVLQSKKNTAFGIDERFNLINSYSANLAESVRQALNCYPKTKVQPDDIVDAAALCLSAEISLYFNTLIWRDKELKDKEGRKIYIEAGQYL
jgi:predicted RNase H-like nuclease